MDKYLLQWTGWLKIAIVFLVAIIAIYLNRAYAHIYDHISDMSLTSPDLAGSYIVDNGRSASSTLVYTALGDSLTAGVGTSAFTESFPYLLAQYFAGNDSKVELKDRAFPGAKTADIRSGLLPVAISDNPDIITILIGVNDIHGQVSLDDFRSDYDRILRRLTSETEAKIYVVSIPYIGADNLQLFPYGGIFNYQTRRYNKVISELASEYGLQYIDLYGQTEDLFKHNGPHYSADFFHPSAQGYKIWADLIYASIDK